MTRSQATLALLVCLATGVVTAAQKKTAPARPPKDAAADINTARADATHAVFETTEGTWMSVDVSPDGTTLVFDVLGDLYTVPVAGGTATPLTRGPAYDGKTAIEALRASTREAAQKIGFLPDIGTVETGKLADLVVFDADPLADIHNSVKIRWVVKNGELFDAATLTRRWPSEHPLPRMFWQEAP